jgi:hypothetical protein
MTVPKRQYESLIGRELRGFDDPLFARLAKCSWRSNGSDAVREMMIRHSLEATARDVPAERGTTLHHLLLSLIKPHEASPAEGINLTDARQHRHRGHRSIFQYVA